MPTPCIRRLGALLALAIPALDAAAAAPVDPHSYANTEVVTVRALALDLAVDFPSRTLAGTAELALDWHAGDAHRVVLDTRDLAVERVEAIEADGSAHDARYALGPRDAILGAPLDIALEHAVPTLRVRYRTSPGASGLQWMTPAQTAGKTRPFMYSQSEAIHARSWIPLQDTPAVRFTFRARIAVPAGIRAVMGATNDAAHAPGGTFSFAMDEPVPSYLMAIAAGDLAVRETGPRSAVYAESSVVDAAAREFADTETMIAATERLYGPYRWQRYDVLVLPPSFPYGGMENPRLTFATPTVIAGDKSLVSLVAHELAHSWSGNLVTNANWSHGWLNEGFTSYVENRIVEQVFGTSQADEEFILVADDLRRTMATLPPDAQRLVPHAPAADPDDALSDVAYVKGAWLLRTIEARVGRPAFDAWLRGYFDRHAFTSIATDAMLADLDANLIAQHADAIAPADVRRWIDEPGIPTDATLPASPRFAAVAAARSDWLAGKRTATALDARAWTTQEWMRFLDGLPEKVAAPALAKLDAAWSLTDAANAEIARRWYEVAIRNDYKPAYPALRRYLVRIGRRYLILPLYDALAKTREGRAFALSTYKLAKPGYHPLTQASVEKILGMRRT